MTLDCQAEGLTSRSRGVGMSIGHAAMRRHLGLWLRWGLLREHLGIVSPHSVYESYAEPLGILKDLWCGV